MVMSVRGRESGTYIESVVEGLMPDWRSEINVYVVLEFNVVEVSD